MKRGEAFRIRWIAHGVAVFLASCAPTSDPQIDLNAEVNAIREVNDRWMQAFRARDASGEAAVFAADGVEYRMFQEPIVGPASIEAHDAEFFAANPSLDVTWSTEAIHIAESGEMAIQTGTFLATGVIPGSDHEDSGRILTVWKKEDGEWKVWHAMVNPTNQPPSPGG